MLGVRDESFSAKKALIAELTLAGLLLGYGHFSAFRVVMLLALASQSLWIRAMSWSDLGVRRPPVIWRTVLLGVVAALGILVSVRVLIVPVAVWITGTPGDFSALGEPGDVRALWTWLGQAWTLAAFGEEMVFRGYLMHRITDLVGHSRFGWAVALTVSSAAFGLAHAYQGPAGMIATGTVGFLLGLVYLYDQRNLWTVIICHAIVDSVALSVIYFGHSSWLIP